MKKKTAIFGSIFLVIAFGIVYFFTIQPRILSKNLKADGVFIPSGLCNEYHSDENLTDGTTFWRYKLTEKEAKELETEFESGNWKKPTRDENEKLVNVFYRQTEEERQRDDIVYNYENMYYCLYDTHQNGKGFIDFKTFDNEYILGWDVALFMYDVETANYWCILMGI